jgi:hypothetical protein
MIPKFKIWIEDVEAGGVSVSQPQHKKGEDSLSIDGMIKKRIEEIIDELTRKRDIDKNQIINSIKLYLDKLNPESNKNPETSQDSESASLANQDLSQMPPPQPIQSQTYA